MRSPHEPDYTVGVVGLGAMGQGIAQVSAMGGMKTLLFDAKDGAAEAGRAAIARRIDRLAEKGRMDAAEAAGAKDNLVVVDGLGAFGECDAVVEAIVEDIEVKRGVFADLEAATRADAILATNTSSIPIGAIARKLERRGRVAGMHFFNPVPLMKLVEIIEGPDTDAAVAEALVELGKRMTRTPIRVKDAPGFLVNFGGRAFTTEGLRMAHEGVASPSCIDAILRDQCDFRMGPFELMDLTGIDVNFPVSMIVWQGYMNDPRIATSPLHKLLYDAGRHGRKTRQGHYEYDGEGNRTDASDADHVTQAEPARRVVLAEATDALLAFAREVDLAVLDHDDEESPILGAPLGEDATTFSVRTGADFRRLVCVDLSARTDRRVTLMTAPGANGAVLDAVAAAVAATGRKVSPIADSPGFVAQRMRAFIANLGCYMAEIDLAKPEEIDLALKLGLNYPLGPLEMAEAMGVAETHAIMARLQEITGEDRYRPSLWLRRRALLGLPAHAPK